MPASCHFSSARSRGAAIVRLVLILLVALALSGGAFLLLVSTNLPSVESLRNFRPPVSSTVYSDDYLKIGEFFRERRTYVPLAKMPPLLVKSFIAAEDAQFFHHGGISFTGIFRAMVKNMLAGEVKQGGSTITQQVAKALLLSPERSYVRKAREVVLAFKMERYLTKEEILQIYLNQVYLGHGAYGVASAAQVYFARDVNELSLGQMAVLAGLTRAPSRDNPFTSPDRSRERQLYVLERMKDESYVSDTEYKTAVDAPIDLNREKDLNLRYAPYFVEQIRRYVASKYGDKALLEGGLEIYSTIQVKSAHAAQNALRDGLEELDHRQGYRGPLEKVPDVSRASFLTKLQEETGDQPLLGDRSYRALVTRVRDADGLVEVSLGSQSGVIPIELMRWARKPNSDRFWENDLIRNPSQALAAGDVIQVRLVNPGRKDLADRKIPKNALLLALAQEPLVQGALLAIDPRNGAVRAMVGGYDFEKSEFNRAVQARRQPGSAFKPIIYAAALDHGYTAARMIVDAPIVYDDPTTELKWRPKNFTGKFHGDTIFRECLILSRNVPTIKIVQDIGVDAVIDYAQKFGIASPLSRDFSLALGSSGVTPLELVSAYAVFATGGRKVDPIMIRKITDRDGNVLERNLLDDPSLDLAEQAAVAQQRTLSAAAYDKAVALGKNVKEKLPPGFVLSPQTAFIMTNLLKEVIHFGTGSKAQAIARPAAGKTGTTNETQDAWFIGYTPTLVAGVWLGFDELGSLGVHEEGGQAASPIWLQFMQTALEGTPVVDFPQPDGVMFAQIDPKTGKVATSRTKGAVFEAFREGTEPQETTEEADIKKSPQKFFLEE